MTGRTRRLIAGYEIVCGVWVIISLLVGLIAGPRQGSVLVVAVTLGVAAAFSLFAGSRLWRNAPESRRLSLPLQALLSVGISIPGFAYALRLGFGADIVWKWNPGASWPQVFFMLNLGPHEEPGRLSINVVAIIAFALLFTWTPEVDPGAEIQVRNPEAAA